MLDSSTRIKELRRQLRLIQIFIIFGLTVIFLFWIDEIWFERQEKLLAHENSILTLRIGFYALLLPYLTHYYIYNAIRDIRKMDRFLVDIDKIQGGYRGKLFSGRIVNTSKPSISNEAVLIFGKKYLCEIFYEENKITYFPIKDITGAKTW